ncbi:MAG: hypothetical protein WCD44_00205 [Candidatus Babeliales bacterium]
MTYIYCFLLLFSTATTIKSMETPPEETSPCAKKKEKNGPTLFISPENNHFKIISAKRRRCLKRKKPSYCFTLENDSVSIAHKNPNYHIATLTTQKFISQSNGNLNTLVRRLCKQKKIKKN